MLKVRAFALLCTIGILFIGAARVRAQAAGASVPAEVALEVDCGVSQPTHVQVSRWMWTGNFRRIEQWRPAPGAQAVGAVRFSPVAEGEAVRVKVSVLVGPKHLDDEEQVASYLLREGEEAQVEPLTRYGVAPCGLKIVRVRATEDEPPTVINKTSALEVLGVEPKTDESFPAYRVRVRNNGARSITDLLVYTYTAGDRGAATHMPHNQLDLPLIEPGAVHELFATSNGTSGRTGPDGFRPRGPSRLIIAAAVFADGSYEGDADRAAYIRALRLGRKTQVARVLTLYERALADGDADSPAAIARFKAQVAALAEECEPDALAALRSDFPTLPPRAVAELPAAVQFSLHQVKIDLLKSVAAFEQGRRAPGAETFGGWLRESQAAYQRWRTRL